MKPLVLLKSLLLLAVSLMLLSGCATEQAVSQTRYVWPPLPDQPKIEWIKSYYAQNDFPKSAFTVMMEIIFGTVRERGFSKPIDIKSDGKGLVYVTDIAIPGIFRIDLKNQTREFWARGDDPDTTLDLIPYFISIARDGNLYVVGSGSKNVYVVDTNGVFITKFNFSSYVKAPAGILVDSDRKRVYLVDITDGKVAIFDLKGNFISSFGKSGEQDGEFNHPSPITMNSKGEIIVGDVFNCRIQIFDGDGKFLRMFGQRGDSGGEFQIIKGVAVDSDNNIYVTDGKANQVKIFSSKGEFLMAFGKAHSVPKTMLEAPGGFLLPQGIHIDSTDTIYIADQANMRFQVFKYLKEDPKKESDKPMEKK